MIFFTRAQRVLSYQTNVSTIAIFLRTTVCTGGLNKMNTFWIIPPSTCVNLKGLYWVHKHIFYWSEVIKKRSKYRKLVRVFSGWFWRVIMNSDNIHIYIYIWTLYFCLCACFFFFGGGVMMTQTKEAPILCQK